MGSVLRSCLINFCDSLYPFHVTLGSFTVLLEKFRSSRFFEEGILEDEISLRLLIRVPDIMS